MMGNFKLYVAPFGTEPPKGYTLVSNLEEFKEAVESIFPVSDEWVVTVWFDAKLSWKEQGEQFMKECDGVWFLDFLGESYFKVEYPENEETKDLF